MAPNRVIGSFILLVGIVVLYQFVPTTLDEIIKIVVTFGTILGGYIAWDRFVRTSPSKTSKDRRAAGGAPAGAEAGKAGRALARKPRSMPHAFDLSIFGGGIGGAIAGLYVGVAYVMDQRALLTRNELTQHLDRVGPELAAQIFLFGVGIGLLAGFAIEVLGRLAERVRSRRPGLRFLANDIVACLIAGTAVGVVSGAFGGIFFKDRGWIHPSAGILIGGGLLGPVGFVVGPLFLAEGQRARKILRASVVGLVMAAIIGLIAHPILSARVPALGELMDEGGNPMVRVGMIIGGAVGILLGLHAGITRSLFELWEAHTRPGAEPAAES